MAMTTAAANALAGLIFINTNWANIGDATGLRGSTIPGVFGVSVHTADPGAAGTQTTSEANYTGYVRPTVVRSAAGWTQGAGGLVSNAAIITFGAATAGNNTLTYVGIGTAETGAGSLITSGALTAPYSAISPNEPRFLVGALTATVS